jgi:hypothetical protein
MLTAVFGEISLPVALNVQPPRHHPAVYRLFPNGRVDGPALPQNVAWKTNIH